MKFRVTISMPCYGRPERTKRAINSIIAQTVGPWEAFILGDGCPHFAELLESDWFKKRVEWAEAKGNRVVAFNFDKNYGGYGSFQTNYAISQANGEYFTWLGNDDILSPFHFANYLAPIEGSRFDWMYFRNYRHWQQRKYRPRVRKHLIGHSDIIVKTEFLRRMGQTNSGYAQDWDLIAEMKKKGQFKFARNEKATYIIMQVPSVPERGID